MPSNIHSICYQCFRAFSDLFLQSFDTVGWVTGKAPGLCEQNLVPAVLKCSLGHLEGTRPA